MTHNLSREEWADKLEFPLWSFLPAAHPRNFSDVWLSLTLMHGRECAICIAR